MQATRMLPAPEDQYVIVQNVDNSGDVGLGLEFAEPAPGDVVLTIRSIDPRGSIAEWNREQEKVNFLDRRRRTAIPVKTVQAGDCVVQVTVVYGPTPLNMPATDLLQVIDNYPKMDLRVARISLAATSRGLQLQPPPKRARRLRHSLSSSTGPSTMSMSLSLTLSHPDRQEEEAASLSLSLPEQREEDEAEQQLQQPQQQHIIYQ